MNFRRLLAKSSRTPDSPRDAETLAGHLGAVTRVATLLADRWGGRYLAALGLDEGLFGPRLRLALPRAALAHDWGKANDHFQRMVRADRGIPVQAAWHEQLSVWLALDFQPLGSWLFRGCDEPLRHTVLAAVLGHHLRAEDGVDICLRQQTGALQLVVLSGHPDFQTALGTAAERLGLPAPPDVADAVIDVVEPEAFESTVHAWIRQAHAWWGAATPEERRFVAALKALLVGVDLAGSAVPRMPADPLAWTQAVLERFCTPELLEQVVAARLGGVAPRPFQRAVAASPSRVTFVRAGCGSGKTAAAYLWAARRAEGRKLFFCYPTTGTASQGFADYLPPDEFDAALIHSRAAADLEDLLTNGPEEARDRLEWLTRYLALAAWSAPITVCTVDTVLGLIQNNRAGVFSFPSIANGAFVFDEIHQYDDRLFGGLLRFLDAFRGAPTLLMTASLPRARLVALQQGLDRLGERLLVVEGPAEFEALKRYAMARSALGAAWDRARATAGAGGRVLWVANTVGRAIEVARQAEQQGLAALPYHSRYRYQDRLRRHNDVIAAFAGAMAGGALAVTTQVCEVSLDLSADLLITDLAPIPALIQRLGRLNRRATPAGPVRAAPALVVEPPRPEPYTAAELGDARRWLDQLGEAPVSQADLAVAFDAVLGDAPAASAAVRSAWLDGGPLTGRAALREEGVTIPVVRHEDYRRVRGLSPAQASREVIRLTIPMPLWPVAREIRGWQRERGALVAPEGRMDYDARLGGRWR